MSSIYFNITVYRVPMFVIEICHFTASGVEKLA